MAGFANVALDGIGTLQHGEVDQLFVTPDHGGRGVARLLLHAVERAAREHGLARLIRTYPGGQCRSSSAPATSA